MRRVFFIVVILMPVYIAMNIPVRAVLSHLPSGDPGGFRLVAEGALILQLWWGVAVGFGAWQDSLRGWMGTASFVVVGSLVSAVFMSGMILQFRSAFQGATKEFILNNMERLWARITSNVMVIAVTIVVAAHWIQGLEVYVAKVADGDSIWIEDAVENVGKITILSFCALSLLSPLWGDVPHRIRKLLGALLIFVSIAACVILIVSGEWRSLPRLEEYLGTFLTWYAIFFPLVVYGIGWGTVLHWLLQWIYDNRRNGGVSRS